MTALLVTGAGGQLGSDLVELAPSVPGVSTVRGLPSAELDITNGAMVADAVATFAAAHSGDAAYAGAAGRSGTAGRLGAVGYSSAAGAFGAGAHPGAVVINAAAYTAVDAAESDPDAAYEVNAVGPALLAAACARAGVPLVHVSTDYVFAGNGCRPYDVSDPTGPRSVYGRTKLAGERAVLASGARAHVVRTAWVYGATGTNFVRTMARLQRSHQTVSVVHDQLGSPTWSRDLAAGLVALALSAHRLPSGVLHCTNGGHTTWHGFAQAIFAELGADPQRVLPCTSAQYPRPAPRPAYSVLSPASWTAAGLPPMRPWRDALAAAFAAHRDTLSAS